MEMLCIDEFGSYIVLLNKSGRPVVRLFFNESKYSKKISIDRLFVLYEYRRFGWASFVLKRLFEKYKNYSFYVTALSDNEDYISNKDLIDFYKKFGFKKDLRLNGILDGEGTVLYKE